MNPTIPTTTNPESTTGPLIEHTLPYIENPAVGIALKIALAVGIVLVLIIISKILARFARNKIAKHMHGTNTLQNEKIANLVSDIIFYTLVIFSLFIGFEVLGFDVGLIIGGISFGVGLAFKEILGNMIAGVMVLSTKQINIGDVVEVQGDTENFFGRIEEITIRNTIIRTLDLRKVVLPNMTLISKPIKTYSSESIVRLQGSVQVDYKTDLAQAQQVVTTAINTLDFIKAKENTKTTIHSFDESGITINYYCYFDPKQGLLADYAIGHINEIINTALHQHHITIPYPHRVIINQPHAPISNHQTTPPTK